MGERVIKAAGDRWSKGRALVAIAAACFITFSVARVARAHDANANLPGSCQVDNVSGRATMTVTVTNNSSGSVLNITPSDLVGSASGSATFFVQTSPRPLRELLSGKSSDFVWKGRFYGDGLIDLSLQVFADFSDGHTETTGVVNCNRVAVGNPDGSEPATATPAISNPTPTDSGPANTATPTNPPARPTRTPHLNPTATPTSPPPPPTHTSAPPPTRTSLPTRTPIAARATRTPIAQRPSRTPMQPTNTPTRVPTAARPTSTPTRLLPTRTPTRPGPTRTPVPVRPTRTTAIAPTARPTRTPNNVPPTPTWTPGSDPPPNGSGLVPSCSLRRTGDVVNVTMVVENRTGAALQNVVASTLLLDPEGGALFFDRTGPSPTSQPTLGNGLSTAFQWGGRLSDGGTMGFSAFVTANSPNGPLTTQAIDCGATGSDSGTFDPATFSGQCSIAPGANGQVTVMIRNGSSETLTNIVASFVGKSGLGTAQALNISGPSPHNVQTLSSSVERDFSFGANFDGSGQVTLQFRATAVRGNGQGISTATISCSADVGVASGNLPDLTVRSQDLQDSIQLQTQNFTAASCAVVEGCVDGLGARNLLRFDTVTPNLGPGDVFLGNPIGNPNFVFSDCHMHYHFEQYADYRLLDMSGNIVARGHKQAFCLVDLWQPPDLNGNPHPQFTNCGFQGISSGWADVYNRELDCQWIDVTGVPSGRYVLEVEINPAHVILESNYNNNVGHAEVTIP